MAQKIHPKGFRLGLTQNYSTQWFTKNKRVYSQWVFQDSIIRQYLAQIYPNIIDIVIQRTLKNKSSFSSKHVQCSVQMVLSPIESLSKLSPYSTQIIRMKGSMKATKKINKPALADVKKIEAHLSSQFLEDIKISIETSKVTDNAQAVAVQLQNALFLGNKQGNLRFKAILKRLKTELMSNKTLKGFRIELSGRSTGSLMASREYISYGKMPRQTLRIPIDYASFDFLTKTGLVGAKIWIHA